MTAWKRNLPAPDIAGAMLAMMIGMAAPLPAHAEDSANARSLVKNMSEYLAAQTTLSFDYDTNFEIVTKEKQKLALASSGSVLLNRPDKVHSNRFGGFANIEMLFDGKTLTVFGKNANLYTQVEVPGTVDNLVDVLRDKYDRPLPGADLLMANVHDQLMPEVVDAKDLGSGVIGGVECDHLAFRTKEVDWQIWIAQGNQPYPCRYVITSKLVAGSPQYSIQIHNWKTGGDVPHDNFVFNNSTNAKQIDLKDLPEADELPSNFVKGKAK
ncbi:DUF2092 domain-containing protein [Pseudomonas akapageensis]|uniref:DUF2092 domain-containing protein n=1 Tax=Pseudomonas akapageensis TaxID=2609961 RepID=UPI0015B6790B|nr:DUF2092 domain-containing protein [Pseudomonas akapageensis]